MNEYKNQLKNALNDGEIISFTRMMLSEEENLVVVIVEGESDEKFLNNHVSNNVVVREACGGCKSVESIIEGLNAIIPDNRRFISIKDRDYNKISPNINEFYYDYNSLETFLFSMDKVLHKVCNEYYRGQLDKNTLREHIMQELRTLSTIRKLDSINKWNLKFTAISIDKLCEKDSLKLDKDLVIKSINNSNKSFFDKNPQNLQELEVELAKQINYVELLQITQGHDLISLFQTICNIERSKKKNKRGLQIKDIESTLRASCSSNELVETNFYRDLKNYEEDYKIKILDDI